MDAREDDETEGMEEFTVVLNSTDSVDLVPDEAVVEIIDDNSKMHILRIGKFCPLSSGVAVLELY